MTRDAIDLELESIGQRLAELIDCIGCSGFIIKKTVNPSGGAAFSITPILPTGSTSPGSCRVN
ncbi:hypothetical protein [Methylococcus mesophilus]|uniref:hypothetical protein n=1 Tax=Methylococcus mesophilus TaxID=2993564 RepID=UPI00224AC7B6|nr:hypothetical protein [Methylococcus mesophilus]UZR27870.1 hypothetical protein OOT43_14235 [Methylococcus mesophilus]